MQKVNLLTTAIKLMQEVQAEQVAKTAELHNLQDDYDLLTIQHGEVAEELKYTSEVATLAKYENISLNKAADSISDHACNLVMRLESTSNAVESLTDELCEAGDTISKLRNDSLSMASLQRKLAEQSVEIKGLNVYKRKFDVASKDLKSTLDKLQVEKVKNSLVKPVKAVKSSHKKQQAVIDKQAAYIQELLEWGRVSPRYGNTLQHSTQGMLDVLDLKIEESDVSEKGGVKTIEKCHRIIVINKFNSMKMLTRVIGQEGIHKPTTPKGWTVQLDDEVMKHVDEYIEQAGKMDEQIVAQGKLLKKAGK